MKKSIFFAALMMGAFVLTGCNSESGTPEADSTKLWPAQPSEDNHWGFTDGKSSKLVIGAKYNDVESFSCGYARVQDEENQYAFIDKNGQKQSSKLQMDENGYLDTHFYYDVLVITYDGHRHYVDKDFARLTKSAEFTQLGRMTADGLAECKREGDDVMGYTDKEGNLKIQPKYTEANPFMDGVAVVMDRHEDGTEWYYTIDTKGNVLCEETKKELKNLGEGRILYFTDQQKAVLCDKMLNEIDLAASYSNIGEFTDGLAMVTYKNSGKICYIDPKGVEKTEQYAAGEPFYEGLAWVKTTGNNGKWIVINNKGGEEALKLSSSQNVGFPKRFHNGLTYYNNGTKIFLADKNGDVKYEWKTAGGGNGYGYAPAATGMNPMRGTKYASLHEENMERMAALQ